MTPLTSRIIYFITLIMIIILGLLSKNLTNTITEIFDVKDAIWAMMVYFLVRIVFINWPVIKVAVAGMIFSILIEVSQLYHAVWIDQIRNTFMGSIVLGSAFVWTDLIAYLAGTVLGFLVDYFFRHIYMK